MVILKFENQKFHQYERPVSMKNIDVNKIVASNKASFGKKKSFKYFIGYKDAKAIIPLGIFLPKKSAYRKDFDETKFSFFFDKRW